MAKKKLLLRSLLVFVLAISMILPLVACDSQGNGDPTVTTTQNPDGPDDTPGDSGSTPNGSENQPNNPDIPSDSGNETPDVPPSPPVSNASKYTGNADTSWYVAGQAEYHLTSADQLAGLATLVNGGNKFDGVTIYLDCDIVWNDGEFTIDASGNPLFNGQAPTSSIYTWTPIGLNTAAPHNTYTEANGFTNQFYGNLDGQGHYISGLYTKDFEKMSGLFTVFYGDFIKNLSIVNSYIGGDSRTGSFFAGCFVTEDWGTAKDKVSATFENLYSDAYIVTDLDGNSRSGGIGGMLRPLSSSNAANNGFIAEFNNCWFDGTVFSTTTIQYNGGILGVAAYGDTKGLGSKIIFNDCLVSADIYGKGNNTGLVLGNIYIGIAEFNNVVAIIENSNVTSGSSGIVSTLEGNNSAKVTVNYNNVFYAPAAGLGGSSYNFNKSVEGTTGIVNGAPTLDANLLAAATTLNNIANGKFVVCGDKVILKGFGFELTPYTEGLSFKELSNNSYEVSIGTATDSTIVIPSTYNGKPVTKIAANAFAGKNNIKSIYIPKSITEVGAGALKNCTGLNKIIYIGNKADWNKVTVASDWAEGLNAVMTECTDGIVSSVKFNGIPFSEYTIVIPEAFLGSDYRVAVYLKKQLDTLYGTNLEIQTDAKDYGYEILIGSTKRTTAKAPTGHYYSVNFKDGDLQLQAASVYAYDALNDYLTGTLFKNVGGVNTCVNGFTYSKDITSTLVDGQEYTTKRDANMRIMFFNMWGNSTTNYGPRDQHQMLAAEIVNAYAPDVIGFQEFNNHNRDDGWWSMDSLLEAYGYREVVEFEYVRKWLDDKGGKHETGVISDGTRPTNNFTPIFYNPEKVELIKADFVPYGERNEEGYHIVDSKRGYNGYYMMHNDYFSKSLTWAVFKDKATGKQFGVISTHFWYEGSTDGNKARVVNAEVVNATVQQMLQMYANLPIFVGGDFNCNLSSDPYKKLTGDGKLIDVQTIATRTEDHKTYHSKQEYDKMFVAGNKNVGIDVNKNKEESDSKWMASGYLGTWVKWYHPGGDYDDSIDHIFIYGDTANKLDIKMFDIVASKMALLASDHCPLICDFNLK